MVAVHIVVNWRVDVVVRSNRRRRRGGFPAGDARVVAVRDRLFHPLHLVDETAVKRRFGLECSESDKT